jgi:hypothetical protein
MRRALLYLEGIAQANRNCSMIMRFKEQNHLAFSFLPSELFMCNENEFLPIIR